MELEFDKEIDAILRRASPASGPTAPSSKHLDADIIAAFAENALPQAARSQYTLHLADCDRCRKYLSQAISMNEPAVEKTAGAMPVAVQAAEVSVPWYQSIFRTRSLAVAMGALILVFSGVLGFLVLRTDRNSGNTFVSQVSSEPEAATGGPFSPEVADMAANSNAASMPTPGQVANSAETMAFSANTTANTATRSTQPESLAKEKEPAVPAPVEEKSFSARQMNDLPKVTAAPPPPPPAAGVTIDGVSADEAKRDKETRQAERSDLSLAKRKESDASRSRDLPPAASKSGPGRSGPVQMQNTQNSRNAVQMSVTRSAGGRKFANRDGAWYDTEYKGQATTNVRRGTDEFRKLDSGLRSIANEIDGVVVVVWKSKAYRIQ